MKSRKIAALAVTAALALAACGGDDDDDTSSATDAPAPTTGEAPAATTAAPATTDGEAPATTDGEAPATTDGEAPATTAAPAGAEFAVDVSVCDDPGAATAAIEGPITIGTSYPQSGGPAVLFQPAGDGFQAYIDYYNEANGGINGQTIEVIAKDDQYAADQTKNNVDELVFDDEVNLLSGIIGTANNAAVQADLNAMCIPQLWALTGSTMWGAVDQYPFTSGVLVPYAIEVEAFLTYLQEQGASRLGLIYVNNDFGQEYKDAVDARAGEYGVEVVVEETIDAADSGAPTAQVSNLVAADVDAILAVPLGAQCIAFMSEIGNAQAANADFDPFIYQTGVCASTVFFGAVSNGGNDGVLTTTQFKDVANPEVAASDEDVITYLEAFAASGSAADPSGLAAAGWVTAEATVHVLEEAAATGVLSRESIANAARNVDWKPSLLREGLSFRMDATDGYAAEGAQLVAWDVAVGSFVDVGEVQSFDGLLGVFAG